MTITWWYAIRPTTVAHSLSAGELEKRHNLCYVCCWVRPLSYMFKLDEEDWWRKSASVTQLVWPHKCLHQQWRQLPWSHAAHWDPSRKSMWLKRMRNILPYSFYKYLYVSVVKDTKSCFYLFSMKTKLYKHLLSGSQFEKVKSAVMFSVSHL